MTSRRQTVSIVLDDVLADSTAGLDLAREHLTCDNPTPRAVRTQWLNHHLRDTPLADDSVVDTVNALFDAGHLVHIISTRQGSLPGVATVNVERETEAWLREHGFHWHAMTTITHPLFSRWDYLVASDIADVTPETVPVNSFGSRRLAHRGVVDTVGAGAVPMRNGVRVYRSLADYVEASRLL